MLKILNKLKNWIIQNIVEIFMLLGLFFIVMPTFILSTLIGFYILGVILVALAIFIIKT